MTSGAIRAAFLAAVETAAAPMAVYDLSDYLDLEDVLPAIDTEAVLIQHVVADEAGASIGAAGKIRWEEDATAVLHLITRPGDPAAAMIAKGDAIREALRGTRISSEVTVEAVEPFTDFGAGAVGLYGGAHKGYASNVFITRRSCG